jgi:hypothetical protein
MNSKILKYLILLAFVLLIVAISSFWFTGPSFREKDVVFELEGPTQVISGEEVVYKIKYENNTRSALHDLSFAIIYPEGSAVLIDGKILEDYSEDFEIDNLDAGEKGEKEFRAFLIGEKGSIRVAKAIFSFRAGNLSSTFEKSTTLSATITSAPITITLVAPPSAVTDAGIQYILDYRNTSGEDASDLILEVEYPDGFTPREFDPAPGSGDNTWNIKSLKKGGGSRITISGTIRGNEGESKIATVKLKRKISGEYVDYQKSSAVTVISNPVLGLEVLVNGSTDYSASLGDRLNYLIRYANNSNVNFFGMNLVVKFEGDSFDFTNLDTRGGFFDDVTKTITWNTSSVPEFANFSPSLKGQVNFGLGLKTAFPSAIPGSSQDKFVKVTAKFSTVNVPIGFDGPEISISKGLVTKIGTDPSFNQAMYYNDPNFGSFGPFPLRTGEETYLTMHWLLTNPGNDIENIEIVTSLPSGVQWEGTTLTNNDLPAPVFNPNSLEIRWNLPKLPYGAGLFTDKYEAIFRLKVKPSVQQKGVAIPLTEKVQLTGTDNFTKRNILINKGGLTSNDLIDQPRQGGVQ